MMPSLVVLIILAAAIITPSVGWWQAAQRLDVCNADFKSFKDNTQLEGERSEHARKATETELASAAVNIQGELNETRLARDARYTEFERLLAITKATSPSGGQAASTTSSAPRLSCPDASADFNTRMAEFEIAVSQQLLKTRDEAIDRTIACKQYLEQITDIMTNKPEN